MTPAELITRRLMARIVTAGATIPVQALLVQALDGEKKSVASSGISVKVHVSEQLAEPLPYYTFSVTASLVVSLDDDKGGILFKENYDSLWAALDFLARGENCRELGDELDVAPEGETITHVFACDGFQLTGGDDPDYADDDNGGTWATSFTATLTGRAN